MVIDSQGIMKKVLIKDIHKHLNKRIVLAGWVHKVVKKGKIIFIILRDCSGLTQLVVTFRNPEAFNLAKRLNLEDVIEVEGVVTESLSRKFKYELKVEKLEILSKVKDIIPLDVSGEIEAELGVRLRYRVVDLRRPRNLAIFKIQAELIDAFRRFLRCRGFIEVHTPKIVATCTEGGAELFEVKYFEKKAFLAQSPQIYKQLLVIAGFERVFEVGHAYRAEKHNTIRHLNEYVSLDVEMGFIENENDLMNLQEELVKYMLESVKENCKSELETLNVSIPEVDKIPRLSFREAKEIIVEYYGRRNFADAIDLDTEAERLICRYAKENYDTDFIYITNFPLEARPFYTMPLDEYYSRSFDLLFRGLEISTGSQRIHDYDLLVKSIRKHGLNPEDFKYYLEAFRYGAPPHGGFAVGAERLTMKLLNLSNIREASLFPRDRFRIVP